MIGRCEACGRVSTRLHLHHVIYRQHLRAAGANQWCRDVGMVVCEQCHVWQHSGYKRIPVERIPESALAFAVDVFGEAKAASYLRRYYACEEGS